MFKFGMIEIETFVINALHFNLKPLVFFKFIIRRHFNYSEYKSETFYIQLQ